MEIRIFQINTEDGSEADLMRRAKRKYCSLETLKALGEDPTIRPADYKLIYSGDVDAEDLEQVYTQFNTVFDSEYTGHSLSVSDVVQVLEKCGQLEAGYYFCDSVGWRKIPFN